MIRVVLDTNVLISASLNRSGAPSIALLLVISHPDFQLCLCEELYSEYEEVLRRPKHKRVENEVDALLQLVRERAEWIETTGKVHACANPDDDMVLDCALTARAQFLVTGNLKHFPATWESVEILSPRKFLELHD